MLIGLFGGNHAYQLKLSYWLTPQDICAGKQEVADYLVAYEGFTLIKMPDSPYDGPETHINKDCIPEQHVIDYVTKNSQKRLVSIINVCYEYILRVLLNRPFFLLVYIDAPLLTRWGRYKERYVQGLL
jgi:dCMP deaminase